MGSVYTTPLAISLTAISAKKWKDILFSKYQCVFHSFTNNIVTFLFSNAFQNLLFFFQLLFYFCFFYSYKKYGKNG